MNDGEEWFFNEGKPDIANLEREDLVFVFKQPEIDLASLSDLPLHHTPSRTTHTRTSSVHSSILIPLF